MPGEKKEIQGAQEAGCVKTGKKGITVFKLIESHQPTCCSSMKGLPGPPGPKGQEGVPGPKVTSCNPVVITENGVRFSLFLSLINIFYRALEVWKVILVLLA